METQEISTDGSNLAILASFPPANQGERRRVTGAATHGLPLCLDPCDEEGEIYSYVPKPRLLPRRVRSYISTFLLSDIPYHTHTHFLVTPGCISWLWVMTVPSPLGPEPEPKPKPKPKPWRWSAVAVDSFLDYHCFMLPARHADHVPKMSTTFNF